MLIPYVLVSYTLKPKLKYEGEPPKLTDLVKTLTPKRVRLTLKLTSETLIK